MLSLLKGESETVSACANCALKGNKRAMQWPNRPAATWEMNRDTRGAGWLCDRMKLISLLDGVCLLILIKSALTFSDARLLFFI